MYNSPEYQSILNVAKTYLKEIADPKFDMNQTGGENRGEGAVGKAVLGKDKDSIIKTPRAPGSEGPGNIGKHEMTAMERMDGTPGFPRLLQKDVKQRKDGDYDGKIAMGLAKGKEMDEVVKTMPQDKREDAFRKLIGMRKKMHQKGVAHNDMHGANVFVDDDNNTSLIDFGKANVDPLAALGEALGFTNELMPSDMPFHGMTESGGKDGYDMKDSKLMELLGKNHTKVMQQLSGMEDAGDAGDDRYGRTEFDKFKMMPHGLHDSDRDFDQLRDEVGDLNDENVFKLIDMYYDGVGSDPTADRMARGFEDLKNTKKRIARGGNLRRGERLVPDRALDD